MSACSGGADKCRLGSRGKMEARSGGDHSARSALHTPSLDALALPPCDEEIESSALGRGLIFGLPSAALGAATAIHALATPSGSRPGMTMLGAGLPDRGDSQAGDLLASPGQARGDDYREASRTFRLLHDTVSDRVEEINEAAGVGLIDDWRKAERRLREFGAGPPPSPPWPRRAPPRDNLQAGCHREAGAAAHVLAKFRATCCGAMARPGRWSAYSADRAAPPPGGDASVCVASRGIDTPSPPPCRWLRQGQAGSRHLRFATQR